MMKVLKNMKIELRRIVGEMFFKKGKIMEIYDETAKNMMKATVNYLYKVRVL